MALTLRIENETKLPDGGPLRFRLSGRRGADIGRDPHLDWTLPDPSRTISGKHCEIRWADDGWVLRDVSTNGTFINGDDRRMNGPHRLRQGDRLIIGHYIVAVEDAGSVEHGADEEGRRPAPETEDPWAVEDAAAAPIDRSALIAHAERPLHADFLDWAVEVPAPDVVRAARPPLPSSEPRDAAWVDATPAGAWASPRPARPTPTDGAAFASSPPDGAGPSLPAEPSPAPGAASGNAGDLDLLAELALAAGIPYEVLAQRDPAETMRDLGAMMRIVVERMMMLLAARTQTKRAFRSSEHTMIAATDNNPLKFSPTPDEAIRLVLGPPLRSYLGGREALEEAFSDLANHELRTFAAMQAALKMLVEDIDPDAIATAAKPEGWIGALIGTRKGRLWDHFVSRWYLKKTHIDGGIVGLFMSLFAGCYDRFGATTRRK